MDDTSKASAWNDFLMLGPNQNEIAFVHDFNAHLCEFVGKNKQVEAGFSLLKSSKGSMERITQHIPAMFARCNLEIKPFKTTCYSAIITDEETGKLADSCFSVWFEHDECPEDKLEVAKSTCYEMVFAWPFIFKKLGYQVIKTNEKNFVNESMAESLARVIHARYRELMNKSRQEQHVENFFEQMYIATPSKEYMESNFDQLPAEIRQSNIDNAYHIPTKLLSIGLELKKGKATDEVPLLFLSDADIETMAIVEHQRWCWEKRLHGFTYAPERNDILKTHNCLVPYDKLTEFEKEKDRVLVRLIPMLLKDIGYEAVAIDNIITSSLSYQPKAKAKIAEVKLVAEKLNDQIKNLLKSNNLSMPGEMDQLLSELIEGTGEIAGAFASAVSVQRTYLPSLLLFREYLPDSFLLYKPKDAVGGDFYFVTKKFDATIWVCADCTGHGISAGLLTAICYNYIDQAVNHQNITDPAAIIAHVMPRVETLMRRSDGHLENKSGMELAVCTLYRQSNILFYAGLNRPMFHLSNGQLNEIEPTRYRESFEQTVPNLKSKIIQLKPNDTIYLTSDGFIDQFGGTKGDLGERFKTKRFRDLLTNIQNQNMAQQRETLNQTIEQWRQDAYQEQTDDICVIGVKF